VTRLTRGSWPAWSPDGRRLAFHREAHVYLINADGSGEVLVAAGGLPAWSPDGSRIAFTTSAGIAVASVDGSVLSTPVRHEYLLDGERHSPLGVGKPVWSPDGSSIAFESFGGDEQPPTIYLVDGSVVRPMTVDARGRSAESDPAWSPDGSRIAFWSYRHGVAIWELPTGRVSTVHKDFPNVAYGARPAWSPDGKLLTFTAGWFAPGGPAPAIWITSASGKDTRKLIENGFDAAWSPDGARIAFVRGR
jgi:TolB protein